tara:strand:- start:3 stop:275 length:273 start_codon:yes stop_codon:yes gene_type:complete
MDILLSFLILSGIWTVLDEFFSKPIAELFDTDEDGASCLIAVVFGAFLGYYYAPVIAFSLNQTKESWISALCLIAASFIFHGFASGTLVF